MPNHEKANAATHWLVKRLPRGADKVLAAVGLGKNHARALGKKYIFFTLYFYRLRLMKNSGVKS